MNRIKPKTASGNSPNRSLDPKRSEHPNLKTSVAIIVARRAAAARGLPNDLVGVMAACFVKMGVDFVIDLAKALPSPTGRARNLHLELFEEECTALADAYVKAATDGRKSEKQEIMETIRALRCDSPTKISFLCARLRGASRTLKNKGSKIHKNDRDRIRPLLKELSAQSGRLAKAPNLARVIGLAVQAEVISGFDWKTCELTINEEKMGTLLCKGELPEFLLRLFDDLLVVNVGQAKALWMVVKDCMNDSTKKKFDKVRDAIAGSIDQAIAGQSIEPYIDTRRQDEWRQRRALLAEVQESRFEPKPNKCLVC